MINMDSDYQSFIKGNKQEELNLDKWRLYFLYLEIFKTGFRAE